MARRAVALVAIALVMGLVPACSSDDGSSPSSSDEVSYELFPSTTELDDDALAALTDAAPDGTLRFAGRPAKLADAKKGSILFARRSDKAPAGLLRYVIEAKDDGGALVLRTMNAPPQAAFRKLHLAATRDVPNFGALPFAENGGIRPRDEGGADKTLPFTTVLFDGDGNEATTDDQVKATGELSGGLHYFFGWDFAWDEVIKELPKEVGDCLVQYAEAALGHKPDCSAQALLPEIKIGYSIDASASAKIAVTGVAYKDYASSFQLYDAPIGVIEIGPFPVVVDLAILGELHGSASSRFSVSTGATLSAGSEMQFSTKTGADVKQHPLDFTPEAPSADVTLSASAEGSVGPQLSAKLFGFAGPTAALTANVSVEADYKKDPCFTAHAGANFVIGFEIGADVPILGEVELAKYEKSVPLVDKEIGSGACKVPADQNKLPPGSGADATTLQTPKYTPWSKTFSGALVAPPHDEDTLQWTDLDQSIDGRYVVAGSRAKTLVKVDGSGKLVWAKRYENDAFDPRAVRPLRVVATKDAAMFVLGYPYALLKVGQGGGVYWAKHFPDVPKGDDTGPNGDPAEEKTFMSAVADGDGGLFAAASNEPPGTPVVTQAWISRMNATGDVVWSKTLRVAGRRLYPIAMAPADGGFVVAGWDWDGTSTAVGRRTFVAKITKDGSVAWARSWAACVPTPSEPLQPKAAIRTSSGDTLIVGEMGGYRRSFTAIVRPDGSIAKQSDPFSGSAGSYMVFTSVRELPTSGFLAAGTYTHEYDPRSTLLAGLDSGGALLWAQEYVLPPTDPKSEASFPAVQPTDEGGAFLVGYTTHPTSGEASFWALDPFAKDGSIAFSGGGSRVTPATAAGTCAILDAPLTLDVADFPVAPKPIDLQVVDAALVEASQAP